MWCFNKQGDYGVLTNKGIASEHSEWLCFAASWATVWMVGRASSSCLIPIAPRGDRLPFPSADVMQRRRRRRIGDERIPIAEDVFGKIHQHCSVAASQLRIDWERKTFGGVCDGALCVCVYWGWWQVTVLLECLQVPIAWLGENVVPHGQLGWLRVPVAWLSEWKHLLSRMDTVGVAASTRCMTEWMEMFVLSRKSGVPWYAKIWKTRYISVKFNHGQNKSLSYVHACELLLCCLERQLVGGCVCMHMFACICLFVWEWLSERGWGTFQSSWMRILCVCLFFSPFHAGGFAIRATVFYLSRASFAAMSTEPIKKSRQLFLHATT